MIHAKTQERERESSIGGLHSVLLVQAAATTLIQSNGRSEAEPEALHCSPAMVTIVHKKITEPIPKQCRFGNSSTAITKFNSQNILAR